MDGSTKPRKAWANRGIIGMIAVAALIIIISNQLFTSRTKQAADETTVALSKFYLEEIAERTVYEINTAIENNTAQLERASKQLSKEKPQTEKELQSFLSTVQELNGLDMFAAVGEDGMVYTAENTFIGLSRFGFLSEPVTETKVLMTRTGNSNALLLVAMPIEAFEFGSNRIVSCITGIDVDKIISSQQLQGVNNQVLCRLFDGTDGTCIVESGGQYADGSSIFDIWTDDCTFSDKYPLEKLIADWQSGTEGYANYISGEGATYLYYKPVPGTSWMVSARLRKGVISEQITQANDHILRASIFNMLVIILVMVIVLVFTTCQVSRIRAVQYAKEKEEELLRQEAKKEQEQQQLLKEALNQAESANRAKTAFLNNMSHDIRTPMNAIIGYANIALKQDITPEMQGWLEKISKSSDHLLTLINDVLDISRIESGKVSFNPVPIDITTITDTVLDIMNGFLAERNLHFEVKRTQPENPYVLADAIRIREVLVNILSNAVKFTEDGGTITFESIAYPAQDDRHEMLRYRIADTGIGMSSEYLAHIFEEFSQEESSARTQYKGSGLGMAITKRYVDIMGGTITVESKRGVGSCFTVELPVELTTRESVEGKQKLPVLKSLAGIRVLLVEDNELNADIAKTLLADEGVIVSIAQNGQQAVEQFCNHPSNTYDVILMDMMMPVMDGLTATKTIRALNRPDAKTIPIVAMTANVFNEDVKKCLEAGMNAHLAKPLEIEKVKETISRVV